MVTRDVPEIFDYHAEAMQRLFPDLNFAVQRCKLHIQTHPVAVASASISGD
jgi:hypothetical protein